VSAPSRILGDTRGPRTHQGASLRRVDLLDCGKVVHRVARAGSLWRDIPSGRYTKICRKLLILHEIFGPTMVVDQLLQQNRPNVWSGRAVQEVLVDAG
jgi:hypothetical protein